MERKIEIPVSFELAKLAKEKGFDWEVLFGYEEDGSRVDYDIEGGYWDYNTSDSTAISAPTQSFLQKWIREVHDIDIYCFHKDRKDNYSFGLRKPRLEEWPFKNKIYEKALNEALFAALKIIKIET